MSIKTLCVLSGSGMSEESGIPTFRGMGGLWEKFDVYELASPQAWAKNPDLVLQFYNARRKKVVEASPNKAHKVLAQLEEKYQVKIVTQNVDDLHERAGSSDVLHLHGEIRKSRSTKDPSRVYKIEGWELKLGDTCELGSQLRPHIVWFGEPVPDLEKAATIVAEADIFVIIGTSLQVYPAASLVGYTKPGTLKFLIDPGDFNPGLDVVHIKERAVKGMEILIEKIA